ncbi:MAG TPA: hypothetical protein VGC41_28155 [Kofleriaceae bacterium]
MAKAKKTVIEPVQKPSAAQTFAEAERASAARKKAQQPMRKQFEKVRDLGALAKLIAANHDTFATLPWLQWIMDGVPSSGDNGNGSWTNEEPAERKRLVKIIEELLDNGHDLSVVNSFGACDDHPLAQLFSTSELGDAQRIALVKRALARGDDPTARVAYPQSKLESGSGILYYCSRSALDVAIDNTDKAQLAAIEKRVSADAWTDAYYYEAIDQLSSYADPARLAAWKAILDRAGDLDLVVTKLSDTDTAALIHFACAADVAPEYLEELIGRVEIGTPLTTSMTFSAGETRIKLNKGSTARDIVEAILTQLARVEAAQKKKQDKHYDADEMAKLRATTERKLALLGSASRGKVAATVLPPAIAATAKQVLRLAKLLGNDTAPIQAAMDVANTDFHGPWGFLHEMVSQFPDQLVPPKEDAPELWDLIDVHTSKSWMKFGKLDVVPAAKRGTVEAAIKFGANLYAIKLADEKGTQIWRIANNKATVVAPSVGEYLAGAIDRWQAA